MKTISIETAKKLKKLGLYPNGTSYFCWVKDTKNNIFILPFQEFCLNGNIIDSYPAYTLDEILEMLPAVIHDCCYLNLRKSNIDCFFSIAYADINEDEAFYNSLNYNKNPAEAAAQLLIWCIENGYMKAEELNNEK